MPASPGGLIGRWGGIAVWCLAFVTGAPLVAAPVAFQLSGTVTSATAGNGFGLAVGDALLMSGVYDSADYDGTGSGRVVFDQSSGNTLTVVLGSVTLTNAMDVQFDSGFPTLYFVDGEVWYPDFGTDIGVNGATVDYAAFTEAEFEAVFSATNFIEGRWDVAVIPEPVAIHLWAWTLPGLWLACRLRSSPSGKTPPLASPRGDPA